MTAGNLSGIATAVLLACFVGGWIWPGQPAPRFDSDAAARLPLEDESRGAPSMSSQWSWYIVALVALNIVGCVWLLWFTGKRRAGDPTPEQTSHYWDEDLTEYNKPMPRWWIVLFYLTIVFSLGYLLYYPGLGAFQRHGRLVVAARARCAAGRERRAHRSSICAVCGKIHRGTREGSGCAETRPVAVRESLRGVSWRRCARRARLPESHRLGLAVGRCARGHPHDDPRWSSGDDAAARGCVCERGGDRRNRRVRRSLSGQSVDAGQAERGAARFAAVCSACQSRRQGQCADGRARFHRASYWLYGGDALSRATATGRPQRPDAGVSGSARRGAHARRRRLGLCAFARGREAAETRAPSPSVRPGRRRSGGARSSRPSFFSAGVCTMVFFALVDPPNGRPHVRARTSREWGYLGIFCILEGDGEFESVHLVAAAPARALRTCSRGARLDGTFDSDRAEGRRMGGLYQAERKGIRARSAAASIRCGASPSSARCSACTTCSVAELGRPARPCCSICRRASSTCSA